MNCFLFTIILMNLFSLCHSELTIKKEFSTVSSPDKKLESFSVDPLDYFSTDKDTTIVLEASNLPSSYMVTTNYDILFSFSTYTGESECVFGSLTHSYFFCIAPGQSRILIFQSSENFEITYIGSINGYSVAFHPDLDTNIVYIGMLKKLGIFDFSILSKPVEIGEYRPLSSPQFSGLLISDNYLFAQYDSNPEEDIYIFDISNTTNLILKSVTAIWAGQIAVSNNYLYKFGNGGSGAFAGLTILDISNISNPKIISQYGVEDPKFMVLKDDSNCIISLDDGFLVISTLDKHKPSLVYRYESVLSDQFNTLQVEGNYLYGCSLREVHVFDISSFPPKFLQTFSFSNYYYRNLRAYIHKNIGFIVDYYQGLKVVKFGRLFFHGNTLLTKNCENFRIDISATDSFSAIKNEGLVVRTCEHQCFNYDWDDSSKVCHGRGNCTSKNYCHCNTYYYGDSCQSLLLLTILTLVFASLILLGGLICVIIIIIAYRKLSSGMFANGNRNNDDYSNVDNNESQNLFNL